MSTIRPDLPAIQPTIPNPVRAAQAAFFKAALAQVENAAPRADVQPQRTETRAAGPGPSQTEPTRATRPGSLLDIRV